MRTPSARIQSLVNTRLLPGAVDQVINYSPVTLRLIGNARKWSGVRQQRAIKYKSSGLGGAFVGLQEFSTEDVPTSIKLTYDIGSYEQPVVIPGVEKLLNSISVETATSLVGYKMDEAIVEMTDGVSDLFYGNSDNDFVSLRDYADDGGQTASIGSQSRSTYSALQGTDTDSGGTVSLAKMRTLISAVSAGSLRGHRPTMGIGTQTVWDHVESLLTPTVRASYEASGYPMVTMKSKTPVRNAELMGVQGYVSLVYAGIPLIADAKSTAEGLYLINEDQLDWYGAQDPDLESVNLGGTKGKGLETVYHVAPSKFHGFNWQPLQRPTNQYGQVGHVYLFGQLVSWQPRRQGILTGISGV